MGNPFVHIELTTSDAKKAKTFYGALFDWNLQDHDMGGGTTYTMIEVGEGVGGGIFQMQGAPTMWLPYVNVDDVKASVAKAKSLGAKIIRDVTEVPGMGHFAIFTDPQGAMLAFWQAKGK